MLKINHCTNKRQPAPSLHRHCTVDNATVSSLFKLQRIGTEDTTGPRRSLYFMTLCCQTYVQLYVCWASESTRRRWSLLAPSTVGNGKGVKGLCVWIFIFSYYSPIYCLRPLPHSVLCWMLQRWNVANSGGRDLPCSWFVDGNTGARNEPSQGTARQQAA